MKLSPHVIDSSADAIKLAQYSPAVKIVDGYSKTAEYYKINPNIFIWGRAVPNGGYNSDETWRSMPPTDFYYQFIHQHLIHPSNQGIVAWETGINESNRKSSGETPDYKDIRYRATYETAIGNLIKANGKIPIYGQFAVGTPSGNFDEQKEAWRNYKEALFAAVNTGGYISLHAYGNIPGWLGPIDALMAVQKELKTEIPVLISECGNEPGWIDVISSVVFLSNLIDYDKILQKYPLIKAATIFSYGNCQDKWKPYKMDNDLITNGLIEYAKSSVNPPIPPQPIKETPLFSFPGAGLPMKLYYAPGGALWKTLNANWAVDVYETQGQWWRVTTGKDKYWVRMAFA
jgi:hypothetical protein